MDIKRDRMVSLGYGTYWRSDRILGLVPIEDDRGPRRRTSVFVEGRPDPIVASRSEQGILDDMAADPGQAQSLRDATAELLTAFHEFSPVLRRALHREHHFDVEQWEARLAQTLRPVAATEASEQSELFD